VTVTIKDITDIPAPVVGEVPATTTETDQYSGSVTWSPEVAPGNTFTWDTVYTATITLSAKPGWTFAGVSADFFKVTGANATNDANSGTVKAVFPATVPAKVALESALKEAKAIAHTFQSAASWAALQAAIDKGDAVDANPDATEAEVVAALNALNAAIAGLYYDYPVMEAFGTWSGSGPLSARINADIENFVQLNLNGTPVDTVDYLVTSGSTIITLHEAYLKSLPAGSHTFIAEFTNGASDPMTLTIASGGGGSAPKTGDSIVLAAVLVGVLVVAAITALVLSRRLKRVSRKDDRH
jgi:LPXTG-motif cell wall-anchored protein